MEMMAIAMVTISMAMMAMIDCDSLCHAFASPAWGDTATGAEGEKSFSYVAKITEITVYNTYTKVINLAQ